MLHANEEEFQVRCEHAETCSAAESCHWAGPNAMLVGEIIGGHCGTANRQINIRRVKELPDDNPNVKFAKTNRRSIKND